MKSITKFFYTSCLSLPIGLDPAGQLERSEGVSASPSSLKRRDEAWPWWPLLPLYPYGKRATNVEELSPGQVWSFAQLQGVYYVAVPIRLTVVKVPRGLMLVTPLRPTPEL